MALLLFFSLGVMASPDNYSKSDTSPVFTVTARYYPEASQPQCPYAKVYWGADIIDFESGEMPDAWSNDTLDANYPWVVTTPDIPGYNGSYCMMSGNVGIGNSTSSIEATVYFEEDGSISFNGGCYGEGTNFDVCEFFIDDVLQFSNGALQTWDSYSYEVSSGTHTFKWSYTKDYSVDNPGDAFFVDEVVFAGVASAGASSDGYNIYRREYHPEATTGSEEVLIASNVTGYQYLDEDWVDLDLGDYEFGVEVIGGDSQRIYWSDPITKSEVANYNVTVSANPSDGGTVSGGGTYTYGESCTLTAIPNDYFEFEKWTMDDLEFFGDNDTLSNIYTFTFIVKGDVDVVANFLPATFYPWVTVYPSSDAGNAEIIYPDEDAYSAHLGDSITLSATCNPCYIFEKWVVNTYAGQDCPDCRGELILSTDSVYTFVFDIEFLNRIWGDSIDYQDEMEGIEFIAYYLEGIGDCIRPQEFSNTDLGPKSATFSWIEKGVAESWYVFYHPVATPTYVPDTMVEVTENPCTITGLSPNTSYEAFMVPACGVEDTIPITCLCSDVIDFTTLEACPVPQHVEVANVTGNTATVTWADYSDSYLVRIGIPSFINLEDFENGIPEGWASPVIQDSVIYAWTAVGGHIQSGNAGLDNTASSISVTASFPADGTIEFDAEYMGEEGWDLGRFFIDDTLKYTTSGYNSGWNHNSFIVTAGQHTFTWTYTKDGSASATGDYFAIDNVLMITEEVDWSESVPVEDAQYTFADLTPNTGYVVQTKGICEDLATGGNVTTDWCDPIAFVTAGVVERYEIAATANPEEGGTITGADTYDSGSTCTLTAMANTGYTFVNWTENGTHVDSTATYSFTVTEARTLVANFSLNSHLLTINYVMPEGVTGPAQYSETYEYGAPYTVNSPSVEGYTPDQPVVSGNMVDEDVTVTVTYTINSHLLTITYVMPEGVTAPAQYSATLNYNASYSVESPAVEGYTPDIATVTGTMPDDNVTVTVTYTVNSYDISAMVSVNPTNGGTVTGAGTYSYGETCNLTAVPATGYHFVKWTKNGTQVSTNANYSFVVTGEDSYVAYFELNSYNVTAMVSVNPTNGGTVTGTGTFNYGETCNLTAVPATGYHFVKWTKNGTQVSTNANYSFVVTGEASYVAYFELNSYAITATANPTAGGTVTGANTYNHGATATLTATPATGYHFVKWTKNGTQVSTNATYSFTVTETAAYVAHFQLNSYEITATTNPTDAGTITGTGSYNYGASCTLSVTANQGYTFLYWTKNGAQVSTNPSITFTVTEAAAYIAHFSVNSYEITASTNPKGAGTVKGAGTYVFGTSCTLTVIANPGCTFVNWTKNGEVVSTNAAYTFTVTEAAEYVANFSLNSYAITATANPTAGGILTGAGSYYHGTNCTLTATANTGYTFVNWTKDGVEVSANPSFTFMVTGAGSYVANFSLNSYEVTVAANPAEGGTVAGSGTYDHGATATLTATANTGYTFVNWTLNGTEVSTNATYSFTVTGAGNYVANFSLNSYEITATANPAEGGAVTGAGNYNHGATATLTAAANTGYTFVNWTLNGTEVSTNATYSFTVTEAGSYVANFSLNSYEVTVVADPANGGTVTGGGTYQYGATATVEVTPNENFVFENWTLNGAVVSEEPTYTFVVTEDCQLVANLTFIDAVGENDAPALMVYPNPAQDRVYLQGVAMQTVRVFNTMGQLVIVKEFDNVENVELELGGLVPGLYTVSVRTSNGTMVSKVVMKQ